MTRRLVLTARARRDLRSIARAIEERAGHAIAIGYLSRLERYLLDLVDMPERGTRRSKKRPDVRLIGFERRVAILFVVTPTTVDILRVLYGGRQLPPDLS